MANLSIDINLMKLSRVGVASIHGVKCVVIPVEENDIYVGVDEQNKAKSAHLHLSAWENKNGVSQYGDTHYIKKSFSKEFREAHPDEAKDTPIIGNAKPIQAQGNGVLTVAAPSVDNGLGDDDNLPF